MIPFWVLATGHSHDDQQMPLAPAPTLALIAAYAVAAAGFGSTMVNGGDVA